MREAIGHKIIVIGATFFTSDSEAAGPGRLVEHVFDHTRLPVALVRAAKPEALGFHAPRLIRREEDISTRVDRWFAENTFNGEEFADLEGLLALKKAQGLTISIGLPALNEEETVGSVIGNLKQALMDDVPLVDEIVLIDSESTDDTVRIAEAAGIPVYKHPDILRGEVGTVRGKGEALWKSLYVLKGDIIAWVDTDIKNIHPRFIYGLIGPLLMHPHIQYVKGYYHRPILMGDQLQAYGGGRVTELVARPLFNLFYPELSGVVQPLAGEYAGRRTALERVPFFSGYGVETGLLIDMHDLFGLDAIAQTNLKERVHHNQPLIGLSKMSFAILQVFIQRLENRYAVQLLDHANRSMKLITQTPERFALDVNEIGDRERPPMIEMPAYQERFSERIGESNATTTFNPT
ncbi:glucosyl-3-phosphoglycerate synthase [bacterium]|nr:glucosyl-3-phosphoglycerate synthase [bacterium]